MRLARCAFMVLSCTVIALAALSGNGFIVSAQSGGPCTPLSPDDLKAAKDACAKAGPNTESHHVDNIRCQRCFSQWWHRGAKTPGGFA